MNSFREMMASQQWGQFNYTLLIIAATLLWIMLYKRMDKARWQLMGVAVVAFLAAMGWGLRDYAQWLPSIAILGVVGYLWAGELKHVRLRIPPGVLIGLTALLLRLPHMDAALWYDETFTAALARLPFDRMNIVNFYDVHPPLWYFISWLNIRVFGDSELALRLPSLAFGVYSVWLVYQVATKIMSRRAAMFAALLVALLPAHIYYAAEARGYTLLVCVVLHMMLTAIKRQPRMFVLLSYIVPMVHSLGLFYLPIIGGWALFSGRLKLRSLVMAAFAALPAAALALVQSRDVADGFWIADMSIGALVSPLMRMTIMQVPSNYLLPILAVVIVATTITLYVNRRVRLGSERGLIIMVLFGVPGLLAGISFVWHSVWLDRAMLPAMTMLPILWATLFDRPAQWQRNLARWTIIPTMAIGALLLPAIKQDASDIRTACAGSSFVYTTSISAAFVADYYTDAPILIWSRAGDLNQTLPLPALDALGWQRSDLTDTSGDVCVIDGDTPLSRPDERAYMQTIAATADSTLTISEDVLGSVYVYVVRDHHE